MSYLTSSGVKYHARSTHQCLLTGAAAVLLPEEPVVHLTREQLCWGAKLLRVINSGKLIFYMYSLTLWPFAKRCLRH